MKNVIFILTKYISATLVSLGFFVFSSNTVAQPTSESTLGEVRKVDKESNKLTLKHGDIKNLDMPAMTMVFRVKDPTSLDKLKPGDKILFRAIKDSSGFVITEITPQ
jgi:Cu(I)/Ag(I) efflux system periplasmic protein CusF